MRTDLLALTDDSLAALANRGIVKRAVREVAEGKGPVVEEDGDAITATFSDGTIVVLPPGATIKASRCTCAASGVCRHRVMLVLAHRAGSGTATTTASTPSAGPVAAGGPSSAPVVDWTPAAFTDEQLEAQVGTRTMGVARKLFRSGYRARVRRPSAADPVPTVELAACTVRFLVPGELGYARIDAARGAREDAIALAVWACRVADELDPAAPTLDVQAGGEAAAVAGSGLDAAIPVLRDLLADGVASTGPEIDTAFAQSRRALDARNLRWPVDVLDDLVDQLGAYRARSARYVPAVAAAHVAESVGRYRCASAGGAALPVQVLGTEEAAETPLRLLRLTGLGARVGGDDTTRTIEVYLAHPEAGVVLALRRQVSVEDGADPPTAEDLGRRKAGGARLQAIAGGNVVTESAVRSANRVVRIAESRIAKTSVTPSAGAWDLLPEGILVTDLVAEATRLAGLAPAVVRARVVAESVRAVAVEAVDDLAYQPGLQQLQTVVHAPEGSARIVLTYTAAAPGALDAAAAALSGDQGPVRYVAGHLRRHVGGIDLEPTAIVVGSSVVVPAFADSEAQAMSMQPPQTTDPLALAVSDAIEISADVVHRGQRHLPPSWAQRADRSARALQAVGLVAAGTSMTLLAEVVRHGGPALFDRWADTHLRLLVTAEQL